MMLKILQFQEDETDVSLSHNRELKKPIDQATDDIPTDKKESGVSTGTPKYKSTKIKIIFVLLISRWIPFKFRRKGANKNSGNN